MSESEIRRLEDRLDRIEARLWGLIVGVAGGAIMIAINVFLTLGAR